MHPSNYSIILRSIHVDYYSSSVATMWLLFLRMQRLIRHLRELDVGLIHFQDLQRAFRKTTSPTFQITTVTRISPRTTRRKLEFELAPSSLDSTANCGRAHSSHKRYLKNSPFKMRYNVGWIVNDDWGGSTEGEGDGDGDGDGGKGAIPRPHRTRTLALRTGELDEEGREEHAGSMENTVVAATSARISERTYASSSQAKCRVRAPRDALPNPATPPHRVAQVRRGSLLIHTHITKRRVGDSKRPVRA
ncbi:hypothetical protein C8R46DRAFT_1132739 [Mycena filopes]|nr:hypothetical protein C8R46DRAFT_1132739 [Mycena filopes]